MGLNIAQPHQILDLFIKNINTLKEENTFLNELNNKLNKDFDKKVKETVEKEHQSLLHTISLLEKELKELYQAYEELRRKLRHMIGDDDDDDE
jgi:hemerythrin-like domain-containing protein